MSFPTLGGGTAMLLAISLYALCASIGIGYLRRPGREMLLWSLAFTQVAGSVLFMLIAEQLQFEMLRRAGLAFGLFSVGWIWSALRVRRGASRSLFGFTLAATLIAVPALALAPAAWYTSGFGASMAVVGLFAIACAIELRRLPERDDPALVPLMLMSLVVGGIGPATFIGLLVLRPTSIGDLDTVRSVNSVGMAVYLVSALTAALALARAGGSRSNADVAADFVRTLSDRLLRAKGRSEPFGSVLAISIDDAQAIRDAAGPTTFAEITDAFARHLRAELPSDADLHLISPGEALVWLCRQRPVIRELLREMLTRVSMADAAAPLSVRLSASVGWVEIDSDRPSDAVPDAAAIVEQAQTAVSTASAAGGDRWVRSVTTS